MLNVNETVDIIEYRRLYLKCLSVILSCNTLDQRKVAENYVKLVKRKINRCPKSKPKEIYLKYFGYMIDSLEK